MRRIHRHIRANAVGYLALFAALTGSAWAAGKIGPGEIAKNAVRSKHLKDGAAVKGRDVKPRQVQLRVGEGCPQGQAIRVVGIDGTVACEVDDAGGEPGGGPPAGPAGGDLTGAYPDPQIAAGAVASPEIANQTVTFTDIAPGGVFTSNLADNAVNSAKVFDNSLTGADINESTLNFGCETGHVLGFARVKGLGTTPVTYTSDPAYIDLSYNCAGIAPRVRKEPGSGQFFVTFQGGFVPNPAALAVVTSNTDAAGGFASSASDNVISVGKVNSGPDAGAFRVEVRDVDPDDNGDGTFVQNGAFTILLP